MEVSPLTASQASASNRATAQFSANFDTFLTLLTTQLRNQDPLEPLDTEQFTQQLVQFSGVEQSIQTNQHLETLIALQSSSSKDAALLLVGKTATVRANEQYFDGDESAWRYQLPTDVSSVKLNILDKNGAVVASFDGVNEAGAHEFRWNGQRGDGGVAAPETYRLEIDARDRSGNQLPSEIFSVGVVNAAAFDGGDAFVEIAGQNYLVADVVRVDSRQSTDAGDES